MSPLSYLLTDKGKKKKKQCVCMVLYQDLFVVVSRTIVSLFVCRRRRHCVMISSNSFRFDSIDCSNLRIVMRPNFKLEKERAQREIFVSHIKKIKNIARSVLI